MSDASPTRPPLTNPLWYLAALMLALGSAMVGTIIAAGAWTGVREASIDPLTGPIDADGRTLTLFTDLPQDGREIACTTRPESAEDAEPEAIAPAALDIVVDDEGTQWHLVALLEKGEDAMVVRCSPVDGGSDNAVYGYAVVDGFDAARRGSIVSLIGGIAGIGLAALILYRRFRLKRSEGDT